MKKIITILLATIVALLTFSTNANAQWTDPIYQEGDELKGTSASYANIYQGDCGYFVCWNNNTNVKIKTIKSIFDYDDNYVNVIVGFYKEDTLVEKVTTKFFVPDGDSDTAYSSNYKTKGLGEKIKNHLKNVGKVRIIASKYSGTDFDLTIPMNKNLK